MLLSGKQGGYGAARRVASVGIFAALAMIFSYVEALLPIHLGVPGIKLGIANLVILTGLYFLRLPEVWLISMLRILLSGLLFGSGMSLAYSFAGGILSLLVMMLLRKFPCFSIVGVSIAGAVLHNVGQITVAVLITKTASIFLYLPILMGVGVVTGFLMGLLAGRVLVIIEKQWPGASAGKHAR